MIEHVQCGLIKSTGAMRDPRWMVFHGTSVTMIWVPGFEETAIFQMNGFKGIFTGTPHI